MSNEKKPVKKVPKKRAETYDPKVHFDGTLEQMINMAVNTAPKKEKGSK